MELVKDIYFNTDKLIENTKVKVSYTGKFYQGNNDKVFIHYGYGENWNNVNDIEMQKTDLGYQAELTLSGGNTLNFCFKNQNNEWDNNCGKNYIFDIEKNTVNEAQSGIETKQNNLVYWGKTFGKKENTESSDNVFWTSENPEQFGNITNVSNENTTGIIEDIQNIAPTSVDAVISNKANSISDDNCFKIISTNSENNQALNNSENIATTIVTPLKSETSIALAPTGFNYWTQKIKNTVCDFFSKVPKLISGNYKRLIDKNK